MFNVKVSCVIVKGNTTLVIMVCYGLLWLHLSKEKKAHVLGCTIVKGFSPLNTQCSILKYNNSHT